MSATRATSITTDSDPQGRGGGWRGADLAGLVWWLKKGGNSMINIYIERKK